MLELLACRPADEALSAADHPPRASGASTALAADLHLLDARRCGRPCVGRRARGRPRCRPARGRHRVRRATNCAAAGSRLRRHTWRRETAGRRPELADLGKQLLIVARRPSSSSALRPTRTPLGIPTLSSEDIGRASACSSRASVTGSSGRPRSVNRAPRQPVQRRGVVRLCADPQRRRASWPKRSRSTPAKRATQWTQACSSPRARPLRHDPAGPQSRARRTRRPPRSACATSSSSCSTRSSAAAAWTSPMHRQSGSSRRVRRRSTASAGARPRRPRPRPTPPWRSSWRTRARRPVTRRAALRSGRPGTARSRPRAARRGVGRRPPTAS